MSYQGITPCAHSHNSSILQFTPTHLRSGRATRNYATATLHRRSETSAFEIDSANRKSQVIREGEADNLESARNTDQHISEKPRDDDYEDILSNTGKASDWTQDDISDLTLANNLRQLMRCVPSSPVILTVFSMDPATKHCVPLGTALSSFSTVSLNPPYVSFNIKCPSKTLDAIRAAQGLFRITFLDDTRTSAIITQAFSRGNTPEAFERRRRTARIVQNVHINQAGANESLAPRLQTPSKVAALECKLTQEIPVADHVVLIAKVNELVSEGNFRATLTYQNGSYKRNDGIQIDIGLHKEQAKPTSDTTETDINPYWAYPILYGETERHHFVSYVQEHLSKNLAYLDMTEAQARKALKHDLHIPSYAMGININHLVTHWHKQHATSSVRSKTPRRAFYHDFYGRLTPRNIEEILSRAVKLVEESPVCVELHYNHFGDLLCVHPASSGLLARDILESLRARKDLEIRGPIDAVPPGKPANMWVCELMEMKIETYFQAEDPKLILAMSDEDILHAIGEAEEWMKIHIQRVRNRIFEEVYPQFFYDDKIDIRGEVTQEEARVIIARVTSSMFRGHVDANIHFLKTRGDQVLLNQGIHPFVSGFDIGYFFNRMLYFPNTPKKQNRLINAVKDILTQTFDTEILQWDDLVDRIRKLVEKHTMHVLKWPREDLVAAMGIHPRAKFRSPLTRNAPRLMTSTTLPVLFAKELRDRYGKGTPEENESIAIYLKDNFDYSVEDASLGKRKAATTDEDSRQELMRNLNIEVSPEQKAKHELEEAMVEFGFPHEQTPITNHTDRPLIIKRQT